MRFFALLALLLLTSPTLAGETAWQEVAPGVKLRLISSGLVKPTGKTLVALEIAMPATTKTYWRVPGDTGFPAQFDFAGSVSDFQVLWPYPRRDETPDYLDYAYFGPTVLPIEVEVEGKAPVAELDVVLGVCSDICVPAQASFSMPLADAAPDRANGLRIRQALALAPMPWQGAEQLVGDVAYHASEAAISVEVADPALDTASLIAATVSGEPVFGTPQKSREPNLVLIPILGKADGADVLNQDVQLTFMTEQGAFEVTRRIGARTTR
jgi:DsbC/DsbD-like thiol-disulfide interchange protein